MKFPLVNRLVPARRSRRRPGSPCGRATRRRLLVERLEDRQMLSATPFGAMPDDTAEYMLGDVWVTLVLMESDGSIDASTEDWTPEAAASVQQTVAEGLQWWVDALALENSVHSLNFIIDTTYVDSPAPTGYEPISRPWDDFGLWVEDFLDHVGFNTPGDLAEDVLAFNNAQRETHGTDWSFTIFVANSTSDPDDRFELGHDFTGSFAFAGGLFFVTPSGRPASTMAHETGHVFYAKDEYPGGASYNDSRGYYDTQNLNAWDDNPDTDSRVDSIMSSGPELQVAYANNLVSPSAKAMIGWLDSDGDGIFDVLDVPHVLEGSGALDTQTQTYRFLGTSSVRTLPNLNPSGLGNDVTINEISRVEYRFDGGDWQTAEEFHTATAELDLTIAVPAGTGQIEIRTIDDDSGVASNVFHATIGPAESTEVPGINGFVWVDVDGDGLRANAEPGLADWTVTLAQSDGTPLPSPVCVEPDDYASGQAIDTTAAAVTLSVETVGGFSIGVGVAASATASTGDAVFAYQVGSAWNTLWTSESRRLRIDFASPISRLQIDVVADGDGDHGRLEVYDASGRLLARITSDALAAGQSATLEIVRATADVAYAIVGGHLDSEIQLDNLRIGVDPTTRTDSLGAFRFTGLDPGAYAVVLDLRSGWSAVSPPTAATMVVLVGGEAADGVDFGVNAPSAGSLWQNPANPLDVDDDGTMTPRDALWVIHDLYYNGSRQLPEPTVTPNAPAPYLDPSGDGYISPVDALLVVRALWRASGAAASGSILTTDSTGATPAGVGDVSTHGAGDSGDSGAEGEAGAAGDPGLFAAASSAAWSRVSAEELTQRNSRSDDRLTRAALQHRAGPTAAEPIDRPARPEPARLEGGPFAHDPQVPPAAVERTFPLWSQPDEDLPRARWEAAAADWIASRDRVFSDPAWIERLVAARV